MFFNLQKLATFSTFSTGTGVRGQNHQFQRLCVGVVAEGHTGKNCWGKKKKTEELKNKPDKPVWKGQTCDPDPDSAHYWHPVEIQQHYTLLNQKEILFFLFCLTDKYHF